MEMLFFAFIAFLGLITALIPWDPLMQKLGLMLFFGSIISGVVSVYRKKKLADAERAETERKKRRIEEILKD
jgi:hypothetical protein